MGSSDVTLGCEQGWVQCRMQRALLGIKTINSSYSKLLGHRPLIKEKKSTPLHANPLIFIYLFAKNSTQRVILSRDAHP